MGIFVEMFNLKKLALKRPIITKVLCHSLNPDCYSKENKEMQNSLRRLVIDYQENGKEDDYELNISEIGVIMMSCCEMLRWLHRHPCHVYMEPTKRLLRVILDNENVEPEKDDYRKVYMLHDPIQSPFNRPFSGY